jgi:cytochrome oxidase assembly protein ShyY1
VLGVLTSRRWLGALAAATLFAVVAFYLGQWQWHRYEEKAARADRIESHYDARPQPVAQVLGDAPLPLAEDWTRVTAVGRYAADRTLLVRNRPRDGAYGYEVLVPLRTQDGPVLLVDRGWVPNAESARALPRVPTAPSEELTVTGWLRRSEPSLGRELPRGQLASIDLAEAAQQVGTPLLGAYLVLEVERRADGSAPERPTPLEPPDTGIGPHQAYAFQWWAAMVAAFGLVVVGARREHLDDTRRRAVSDGAPVPARPRKVRIWDEEDA